LEIVRDTLQAQSAADLAALDELNDTLEQLLKAFPALEPSPGSVDSQEMAGGRGRPGVPK